MKNYYLCGKLRNHEQYKYDRHQCRTGEEHLPNRKFHRQRHHLVRQFYQRAAADGTLSYGMSFCGVMHRGEGTIYCRYEGKNGRGQRRDYHQ